VGIKSSLALLAAVQAAGFTITKDKAIDTHDGYAWHATLNFGKKPIVTVSNGGYGGPDEFDYHVDRQQVDALLQPFYAIEPVKNEVRDHLFGVETIHFDPATATPEQKAEHEKKRAEFMVRPVQFKEGDLGNIIDALRHAKEIAKDLKRQAKTHILVLKKDQLENGSYTKWKVLDTPENRENILKAAGGGEIDCFIADLLVGL
jgi:hypothetical protein